MATGEPFIQHQRNKSDIVTSQQINPTLQKLTGRTSFGQSSSASTNTVAMQKAAAKKMHQKI
jgi:hypothetical protein